MTGSQPARVETCDVCIVGAGIAGLNALFAASRYLSRDQKVILIDRRARVGGMWVDVYSYVRLHQPHPMFTAGNIEWTLGKDRAYLATKGEVLDHFQHCVDVIRERVQVDEYFGWDFESEEEANGIVRVTCTAADGRVLVVDAKRLIKAYGLAVTPNEPLDISSKRVHSVSPDYCDVRAGDIRESDAPVWIIGGGKTAMDTAHALITEYPGREVNLVAGRGTFFCSRDNLLPSGARRWWKGTPLATVAAQMGRRFDGTNAAEVQDWFRATYGTFLTPQADNFALGVLSEAENRTISAGLNDLVMDYLEDAVDRNGATELVFRSGSTKAIQPGSWVVNCTGYVGLTRRLPVRALRFPQWRSGLDQCAVGHAALACVHGVFPRPLAVLGQDQGYPAVRSRFAGTEAQGAGGVFLRAFRASTAQPQLDLRQCPEPCVQRERPRFR